MGKLSRFNVPLQTLKQGVSTFSFHLDKQFFADMENTDIHDANVEATLTVTLKDDIYSLLFDVKGTLTLLCTRCLDQLPWPVDTAYSIAVEIGDAYNDESDTLLVIPRTDPTLNVAYMLYDTVVLTIPIRHVHPQGKCNRAMSALLSKHRAPGATDEEEEMAEEAREEAADAPADPRWDALKDLAETD